MNASSWLRHALRASHRHQKGQILIMAALCMAALLGAAAIAIDIGYFMHGRQDIQNAVDAAALAAAQELPDHGETAEALANQYLDANDAEIEMDRRDITFRCIVGDRDGDGQPDAGDIPIVCNPGAAASFTCSGSICISPCDFSSPGNKCNTVVVGASKDVPFFIAPILGIAQADTGDIKAAACRGVCGGPPTIPLDVAIIIDRTRSMSTTDVNNAKNAAKAVLEYFNPDRQHVALGALPQSKTANRCQSVANGDMNSPSVGTFVPVGLSDDYQNPDGSLNTSSTLVSTINCLELAPSPCYCSWYSCPYPWCPGQTDLGDPVKKAAEYLEANGRPDVKKGIIFMTDGEANLLYGTNPCQYAYNEAVTAKGNEIEIFTIGFGVQSATCTYDASGPYHNQRVTTLLADMATDSLDDQGHCADSTSRAAENADGDHFLCEAKGSDLAPLFEHAAATMAVGSRLIQVPD